MKIFLDANICLDLLDSSRPTSAETVNWYLDNKDKTELEFYFSADFITTIFYVLTEKRAVKPLLALEAISRLSNEVEPIYLQPSDFLLAKANLKQGILDDFEDLFVLQSAKRQGCNLFITRDKQLLKLANFADIEIKKLN